MDRVILFDFDNTLAHTEDLRDIRESGHYDKLTPQVLESIKLYRQIPALLKRLRDQGALLGVVTNAGRGYIERLFAHLGITDTFDTVVTYTDVRAEGKKPSPKGLLWALENLGVKPSPEILYIGDDNNDAIAAYRAGITPVMPSWASRRPVAMAPAIEMSSAMLGEYFESPDEFHLFAEKCADLESAAFSRKAVYFLPLDSSGNVVTVRTEMSALCFGRYFSQKGATTAWMHDHHALSQAIVKKEEQNPFQIPPYWPEFLTHVVLNTAAYIFNDDSQFDVITVIPSKKGKDPRLERLLTEIESRAHLKNKNIQFISDVFYFLEDATSLKTLHRNERYLEANRSLHITSQHVDKIMGKRILVIDDVITTGSTLNRAQALLLESGSLMAIGIAMAKTVSIIEDEHLCPKCSRVMRVQKNKKSNDRFWSCTGYKDAEDPCNYTESLLKKDCPSCGRAMRIRTNSKTKEKFWGCPGYNATPSCSYSCNIDPNEMPN